MGQCCINVRTDPDIENAKNVDEIIDIIYEKKKILGVEKEEIEKYLVDPKTEIETISIDNLNSFILQERIPYLEQLDKAFEEVINKLNTHPNIKSIDLDNLKEAVINVITEYYLSYDPNGELKESLRKFNDFLDNSN